MKNGLYSIHVSLQDGRSGKGSGVVMFRDGKILGGDAYLFYTGSYTVKVDTFKGEVLVQRHTSIPDANPLFDAPSVRLCRFALLELDDLNAFGEQAAAVLLDEPSRRALGDWPAFLEDCLNAAGGYQTLIIPAER